MLEEPLGGGAISPLLHQNIQDDSIRAVSHPTWPITLSLSGSHKVQGQPSRPAALRQIMRRTLTFDHNGRHPQLDTGCPESSVSGNDCPERPDHTVAYDLYIGLVAHSVIRSCPQSNLVSARGMPLLDLARVSCIGGCFTR
jgi:hypothetical protein